MGERAKASDMISRMRETALRDRPRPQPEEDPPSAGAEPVQAAAQGQASSELNGASVGHRTRLTSRFTVDLSLSQRKALKLFALEADVDASRVVRTLLELLSGDRAVADKVRGKLERDKVQPPIESTADLRSV